MTPSISNENDVTEEFDVSKTRHVAATSTAIQPAFLSTASVSAGRRSSMIIAKPTLPVNHIGTKGQSVILEAKRKSAVSDDIAYPAPSKPSLFARISDVLIQYGKFVGPGFLIAVAYIDPGNYATDVGAGASTQYAHLFVILMSNLFAIFLQSLCIKLGSVTGLDLAQNCRKHLPRWLNWTLYILAELAIIATDAAEVIGFAIALNLLTNLNIVAGCVVSFVEIIFLLLFYNPDGSMTGVRLFEYFVAALVLGVMVCFCIQLTYIRDTTAGEVFKGYLPSAAVINGNGIYLSCGILGATVMPHSIFLGSGVVQPRLRQFDSSLQKPQQHDRPQNQSVISPHRPSSSSSNHELQTIHEPQSTSTIHTNHNTPDDVETWTPSISAIRTCLKYSIFELASSLFTFALFVNSAILIVAGSALYDTAASTADLFGIHALLTHNLSKAAGVLFALALLLSGTSAGIVCTMAGQMVSEGMICWTVRPWVRRLITRLISVIPSIVIAASVGKGGLNTALTASQVVLSVILPFVTAPLIWFTCRSKIMTVKPRIADRSSEGGQDEQRDNEGVNMRNGWIVTILAVLIWLVLVIMNVALLVLVGLGDA